jgi:hypothetical protein
MKTVTLAIGTMLLIGATLAAADAGAAARPLKPPRPGAWKLIAASNTPQGLKVEGGVVGSFRVTRQMTIAGFHLHFTEGGESRFCAGGEEGQEKSGTVKFAPGATAPIVHAGGAWVVGVDAGSIGGGTVQAAEVSVVSPLGATGVGLISATLSTRKGLRSGDISWGSQRCAVAFVVKPG